MSEGHEDAGEPKEPPPEPPTPSAEEEKPGPGVAKARTSEVVPRETEPEARNESTEYRVALPTFEGPLDLLLHLIQKHELDILDIPIAFITEKYVEYIFMMEQVNIDIASEYLVMAATLAHIKSKMLLPTPPEGQDELPEEMEDPRAELVRRLLEYQKYRLAAEQLGSRAVLGRDVFLRGTTEAVDEGPAPLAQASVFSCSTHSKESSSGFSARKTTRSTSNASASPTASTS